MYDLFPDYVDIYVVTFFFKSPFKTAAQKIVNRDSILIKAVKDKVVAWGEIPALEHPFYHGETLKTCLNFLQTFLLDYVKNLYKKSELAIHELNLELSKISGNNLAKSGIEMAILDLNLRCENLSMASFFEARNYEVNFGASVSIADNFEDLQNEVDILNELGVGRIKLKATPNYNVDWVLSIREQYRDIAMGVDFNESFESLKDARNWLINLDDYEFSFIEQPLGRFDLTFHRRLSDLIKTPICLDESIFEPEFARLALELGAASVICIKPARLGGYINAHLTAKAVKEIGGRVYLGGLYDSLVGTGANICLASSGLFDYPADLRVGSLCLDPPLGEVYEVKEGKIKVPNGPGTGLIVDERSLEKHCKYRFRFKFD
jgi:O-succinylbenzoate synthase